MPAACRKSSGSGSACKRKHAIAWLHKLRTGRPSTPHRKFLTWSSPRSPGSYLVSATCSTPTQALALTCQQPHGPFSMHCSLLLLPLGRAHPSPRQRLAAWLTLQPAPSARSLEKLRKRNDLACRHRQAALPDGPRLQRQLPARPAAARRSRGSRGGASERQRRMPTLLRRSTVRLASTREQLSWHRLPQRSTSRGTTLLLPAALKSCS